MPDLTMLGAFAAATVVLVALPGPNSIYILTRSATQGRRAGVVSALGVETGALVHVLVAVVGLSALVASSPVAMTALTIAGAGYLSYLGVTTLLRRSTADDPRFAAVPLGRVYRSAVLVNLLNPKVVLFFLAFLPQFVSSSSDARPQLLALGVLFLLVAFTMDLGYAFLGATLRTALGARPTATRYLTATVYLGLATYTLVA
jgi:threonine/homoserine/homoserine lactone efflux protein